MVAALQTTAERSQAGVRAVLDEAASAGRASDVRSFWIFNGLSARAAAEDIGRLALRDDVAFVSEDRYRPWVTPPVESFADPLSVVSPEWGIHRIRADEVWASLNVTGTGVVVANMDTGVDWQHPALQAAYRGYGKGLANHVGNWLDATDAGAQYPIDPFGHGTHVMGTIVGAGGIGVAPGARWIAVRVLNASGVGFDSWIHSGFQWILAPGGDASLAPDVLNNSWGNELNNDTTFQNDIRALRGAGIFVVFSNGNNGPSEGTVGSPAALPEAFAVGATDSQDEVASFSSRGPSPLAGVRPLVAAPGVAVRSAVPGGGYADYNGTSMAAPHVAGAVALMLSADPSLSITSTAYALTRTAVPLSTTLPNNDSGYGRIDAYAAVESVAGLGAISGTITRSDTGAPIAGATLMADSPSGLGGSATSDSSGHYVRGLAPSTYSVTVSAFGYVTATRSNTLVVSGTTTPLDFALTPLPVGTLRGSLADAATGQPISGTILIANTPVTVAARASYSATLPGGAYALRATAWGYRVLTASVTITPGQIVTRNFALSAAPTILLIDSGPWYDGSQIGYYRAALDELGYNYAERSVKRLPVDAPISTTLAPYDVVIWSAPFDSPGYIGSGDAISTYLSSGGSLLISGQDVGFWDGGLSLLWSSYYPARLKAVALEDNANIFTLTGTGVFSEMQVSIHGAGGADNQAFPDVIASADPGATRDAFVYAGGRLGAQSVGLCLPYRAVYLGFGFEAITSGGARREVMSRTLGYFDSPRSAAGVAISSPGSVSIAPAGAVVTRTLDVRNLGELGGSDTFTLTAQSAGWSVSLSSPAATIASCKSKTITMTVAIPSGTPRNTLQMITLTAQSTVSPTLSASRAIAVKTPALALVVDDDRFYDVEGAYQTALLSNGITFDRWNVPKSWAGPEPSTPSPARLSWYPFVVWFTGYDWYQPLTLANEMTLTQYIGGGGRVLISAQDYLGVSGLTDFARTRLGILDYAWDMTTTLARSVSGGPFDGLGSIPLAYAFPNYSDALAPYPTATVAFVGSHGRPIALARRSGAGKALFFGFPFEAITGTQRAEVMQRIVGYLSWLGESTASADQPVAVAGSTITVTIVARNDGPGAIASAAFTASLPANVTLQSGSLTWNGPLPSGQSVTRTFTARLGKGLPSGNIVAIPVTFRDDERAITFHREARVGIDRPDLSSSSLSVDAHPARSAQIVTWTLVARNDGLSAAPIATVTGLLPFNTSMISGALASSAGTASEISGTVTWHAAISAGHAITLTYRMTVPATLGERMFFGGALFDDGKLVTHTGTWLTAQSNRFYLPSVRK